MEKRNAIKTLRHVISNQKSNVPDIYIYLHEGISERADTQRVSATVAAQPVLDSLKFLSLFKPLCCPVWQEKTGAHFVEK